MAEIAVGIDLGTSNSCVAVARKRTVEVLPNAFGESTTASVVNLGADGSITVGNAAKANIIHDPTNTIYSAKRLIGRYFFSEEVKKARAICSYEIIEGENHSVRIQVREENFSLSEIGAMVLRELKSIAEGRLGRPVHKAVITVPAYFNDNQRQATRDAGRIAGLEVLRILNEPTAAALAYGFGKSLRQRVAVYDLGGGTFDISVLEIGDDVFEVLSTSGDTFLGGDDFDDRVIDLLADEFLSQEGINLRNDPFALEKLKVAAEDCKKAFSVEEVAEIRIPDVITAPDGSARSIERRIDKAEFWSLVQDLVLRTFKVCDEALQAADVVASDLDGVILVGGPTRLPAIRDAVREYFQQEPRDDVDPDEVVAMGAAIHAASFVEERSEAYLLDVTPLSLQIGVAGGLSETVIERNTPVPIEQSRSFTTARDGQESVKIRVYQGESREAEENELLGQFEFSGFEPGKRGQVAIDVAFQINTDGIVNVTARDRGTGQETSTRITLSSGLSEGEIQSIAQRGVTERVRSSETPCPPAPEPPVAGAQPAADVKPDLEVDPLDLAGDGMAELWDDDLDAMVPLSEEDDAGASEEAETIFAELQHQPPPPIEAAAEAPVEGFSPEDLEPEAVTEPEALLEAEPLPEPGEAAGIDEPIPAGEPIEVGEPIELAEAGEPIEAGEPLAAGEPIDVGEPLGADEPIEVADGIAEPIGIGDEAGSIDLGEPSAGSIEAADGVEVGDEIDLADADIVELVQELDEDDAEGGEEDSLFGEPDRELDG